MDPQTSQAILIGLVILLVAFNIYTQYRQGKLTDLTPGVLADKVREEIPVAKQLMEVAQIAVNATEQLRRERQIQTNDEAFNHALDLVKKWVPDEWEISNADIVEAINAAVLVASALRTQADALIVHPASPSLLPQ